MAEVAYSGSAEGVAKKRQQDILKILPDKRLVVSEAIKYDKDREFGGTLESVAFLTHEHGATYIGTTGAGQDLEPSVVAESKPVQMQPTSFHMTTRVTAELASAASGSEVKTYEQYIDATMRRLQKAARIRAEMKKILGGMALGKASTTPVEVTATTGTLVLSEGSYAPMPWIGSKNMKLDAYTAAGTKLNAASAITVTGFAPATRTLSFSTDSVSVDAIVAAAADVYLYYRSAYGNTGYGIVQVASIAAASSAYLGITPASYPDTWTATQVDWDHSTELFTWDLVSQGLESAMGRGGMDGDILLFTSMKAWRQLGANMEALRVLDHGYSQSSTKLGHDHDGITYKASNGANVTVKPSPCMPTQYVVGMQKPDDLNEICMAGSDQLKFGFPGAKNEALVQRIPRTNYAEIAMFSRDDLWAPCPNQFALWRPAA